jgi:hypothetical protein
MIEIRLVFVRSIDVSYEFRGFDRNAKRYMSLALDRKSREFIVTLVADSVDE